jgi:hypothetical protein
MSTDFFPGIVEGIIDFTNGGGGNGSAEPGFITIADVSLNPTAHISVSNTGRITVNYDAVSSTISLAGFKQGYITATDISLGNASVPSNTAASSLQLSTQSSATITPSESEQTAVAAQKFTTGVVKVAAISSNYVGTGIARKSSTDLTASGSEVTVPSGYYTADAMKAISGGTAKTPATTITIPTGRTNVTVNTSTGNITITGSTVANITPTVSAGYINAGTAGAVTASIAQKTISQTSGSISINNPTVNLTPTISVNSNSGVITVSGSTTATNTAAVTTNGFVNSSNNVNGTITAQIPSGITSALPTYSPSGDLTPSTQRTLVIPKGTYTTGSVYMAASSSGTPEYEGSIPELYAIGGSSTVYETNQKKLTQNITATAITTYSKPASTHVYGATATNLPTAGKYVTNNINVEALTATVTATCTNSAADWKSPTFEIVTVSAQSKFAINLIHDVNVQANASTNAGISSSVSTKFTGFTSPSDLVIESIHVKPAATYTPSSVAQTIYSKNDFINGNIVIAGDSNFISDNIAADVTIWGITGTHEGGGVLPATASATNATGTVVGAQMLSFSIEGVQSKGDIAAMALIPVSRATNSLQPANAYVMGGFGAWNPSSASSDIDTFIMYGIGSADYKTNRVWTVDCIEGVTVDSTGTIAISLLKAGTSVLIGDLPSGAGFLVNTTYQLTVYKRGSVEAYTETNFDNDTGGNS